MFDKAVIARNFSKSACRYDDYADIQRFAAARLIDEVPEGSFIRILEIGCGTGIYTGLLADRFGSGCIRAVDISGKMIEVAREKVRAENVVFEVRDAEGMPLEEGYDLITSSSAVQWFGSVENAIREYSAALKKDAWLVFSTFGPLTFMELADSLGRVLPGDGLSIAAGAFPDKKELERLLSRSLKSVLVTEVMIEEVYPSLAGLLEKIKYTGSRGSENPGGSLWSRGLLKAVEDAYMDGYGRITATYQIFLCRAGR